MIIKHFVEGSLSELTSLIELLGKNKAGAMRHIDGCKMGQKPISGIRN